jgi:RimJ/RimL family protein N-acetyltransferase
VIAYPDPSLVGEQVALRRWVVNDLPLVREACAETELLAGTTLPDPFTDEEGLAFIERQSSRVESGEGLSLAIEECSVGRAVGCVSLMLRRGGVADLGYWLVREARGRRLASETVALLVPWALRELDIEAIEAFVHADNQPSRRLLGACGFAATGVRRHEVGRINEELMVYRRNA